MSTFRGSGSATSIVKMQVMIRSLSIVCIVFVFASPTFADAQVFIFRDTGDEAGVHPHVAGIRGHGAAWGDLDGDGWPDLFLNTFHNQGSKPAMLLRNDKGKFTLDAQEHLRTTGQGSGALFVDLTNSGRLDLYVSNCASGKDGVAAEPSKLFRNDGGGKFVDVSKESGACPPGYTGRGLAALDYDGDGLLDLILCERYYGPVKTGPVLLKNLGGMKFKNVGQEAGLPEKLSGLGVAVGDVNNDGWPDVFFTEGQGDHRLMLNAGKGKFVEAKGTREVFHWDCPTEENSPAGVCIGDVNRDGLPDIVIGHHFKQPWVRPEPIRLYVNRGVKDGVPGVPTFENVTEKAGFKPLAMKAPHVEIQDFDNDGLVDVYVSIVKFSYGASAERTTHPLIYRGLGSEKGLSRFEERAWSVNDFANKEDSRLGRSTDLFAKILKDKRIIYMAPGPSCDYDRDGRLDLFLPTWWVEDRSLLLRNETPGGNWLDVIVQGSDGVNRMGVGARVSVYPAGKLGDAASLIGTREIQIGFGYCSGQEAAAHFGLGSVEAVDVRVTLPHGKGTIEKKNVKAGQRVTVTR